MLSYYLRSGRNVSFNAFSQILIYWLLMLVIIFSYNREEMLSELMLNLSGFYEVIVIDDGSAFTEHGITDFGKHSTVKLIRTPHEGKRGFWKKWVMARQLALGSNHDNFLFIPDDISKLDLDTIEAVNSQGWDEHLYAINVINCGRENCWGHWHTGQEDIEINGKTFFEVGFSDCGILTNRHTMQYVDIDQVPEKWFSRPDKSSGVGYNMTNTMRAVGVKMMMVKEGLCYHGDHESQMHGEFRKQVPLKSKE